MTYTPNPGFTGLDFFNYQVSDGRGGFDTASVTVTTVVVEDEVLLGDVDQDGFVNFQDIPSFIAILQDGEYLDEADVNRDSVVDFSDIGPFILELIFSS